MPSAFDHLRFGFLTLESGVYVDVNEEAARIFGRPASQIIGQPLGSLHDVETGKMLGERYERRLRGEPVPDEYEVGITRPDGARRVLDVTVSEVGRQVLVQVRDITDQIERRDKLAALARMAVAVHELRSDDEIFGALASRVLELPAGLAVLSRAGAGVVVRRIFFPHQVLERFKKLAGVSGQGAVGNLTPDMETAWRQGVVYSADSPLGIARFMGPELGPLALQLTSAAGLTRSVLVRAKSQVGGDEVFVLYASWLKPEDVVAVQLFVSQVSAARDAAHIISDLSSRNAELAAQYRLAQAAANAGDLSDLLRRGGDEVFQLMRCDHLAVYWIAAEGKALELTYQRGLSKEAVQAAERVAVGQTLVGQVAEEGRAHTTGEVITNAAGGGTSIAVPLRVRSALVGVLQVGFHKPRDISHQEVDLLTILGAPFAAALETQRLLDSLKVRIAELGRAQEQLLLQERLAALGELSAIVAHEVRNPLGVLFNSLGSLRKLKLPGEAAVLLEIMTEESDRLNRIVTDLLDFARPANAELRPARLDAVIEDALASVLKSSRPAITVARDYAAQAALASIDSRLVRQAMLNVLANAVQAMPRGGALALRTYAERSLASGRDMVCVEVSDNGVGIPSEARARIFEPFFTTRAAGTGLGLAVVKRIVDTHKGEIEVQSRSPQGTRVVLRFLLAET